MRTWVLVVETSDDGLEEGGGVAGHRHQLLLQRLQERAAGGQLHVLPRHIQHLLQHEYISLRTMHYNAHTRMILLQSLQTASCKSWPATYSTSRNTECKNDMHRVSYTHNQQATMSCSVTDITCNIYTVTHYTLYNCTPVSTAASIEWSCKLPAISSEMVKYSSTCRPDKPKRR